MQPEPLATQTSETALMTADPEAPFDSALGEHQVAELHATLLEHQINPLAESEKRGVPFSALND